MNKEANMKKNEGKHVYKQLAKAEGVQAKQELQGKTKKILKAT